jgi:hypothetical protein
MATGLKKVQYGFNMDTLDSENEREATGSTIVLTNFSLREARTKY